MTKIGIIAVLFFCLFTTKATAGDSYICVADMATGFVFNDTLDKWETTNPNIVDHKYLIRKSEEKEIAWEVEKVGSNIVTDYCTKEFNKNGNLECEGTNSFFMNKNNLRYILVFPHGYHNANIKNHYGDLLSKEGDFAPFIEIGKCRPMP